MAACRAVGEGVPSQRVSIMCVVDCACLLLVALVGLFVDFFKTLRTHFYPPLMDRSRLTAVRRVSLYGALAAACRAS